MVLSVVPLPPGEHDVRIDLPRAGFNLARGFVPARDPADGVQRAEVLSAGGAGVANSRLDVAAADERSQETRDRTIARPRGRNHPLDAIAWLE